MEIRVWIGNLGKRNEGEVIGRWFTLPVEPDKVAEAIGLEGDYQSYYIGDYEAPDGLTIGEYSYLQGLNDIAYQIESLETSQLHDLKVILATGEYDFEDSMDRLLNDAYRIYPGCNDMEDVARQTIHNGGLLDGVSESFRKYFNFYQYGEDLENGGDFHHVPEYNCYIEFY